MVVDRVFVNPTFFACPVVLGLHGSPLESEDLVGT